MTIEMFYDADMDVVRIYQEGADVGEPCIQIPEEGLFDFAFALLRYHAAHNRWLYLDEDPVTAPGNFGNLTGEA